MLSKGARTRGGGHKLWYGKVHWDIGGKILPMSVVQHLTRLSQGVMEQLGDFQHLVGQVPELPHLTLKPVKRRN